MTNYFFTTDTKDWRIKDAYEKLEEEMPLSPMSQLLHQLKTQLKKVLASETVDQEKASAALKLLQSWKNIKLDILKNDANRNNKQNIDNNYGIASIGSSINITINNTIEEAPTTSKRAYSEVNDGSVQSSWNSLQKTRKTKHLKIYLSTSYGETDFGEEHWTVDGINMTATFKEFREKSIKGAQLRKSLSDQRILSLSYIFLISRDSRLLSSFSSDEKALILKDMRLKRSWRPIEEEVTLVCHKIHRILQEDDKISQDAATDIIDGIRAGCNSVDGKAATRIISSLIYRFMDWRENKASESSLIIEVMRPFVFECIIKPSKDIQFEW